MVSHEVDVRRYVLTSAEYVCVCVCVVCVLCVCVGAEINSSNIP